MAVKIYKDQFRYSSEGPLDKNTEPLSDYNDLIDLDSERASSWYVGMDAIVLNTNTTNIPTSYRLVGDIYDFCWKLNNGQVRTYSDLENLPLNACSAGLEMVALEENKKYKITDIVFRYEYENAEGEELTTNDKTIAEAEAVESDIYGSCGNFYDTYVESVTWGEVNTSQDIKEDVATIVEQLMSDKYGNLVYPTSSVYSYTDESGKTIYTQYEEEASGKENYTVYPEGFYVINKNEAGDTVLSEIVTQNSQDGLSINVIGDDF